jgi:acyl carrier protein
LPRRTDPELRADLRAWIVKKSGKIKLEDLKDDTPLIQGGILKSLQVMELILWLERAAQVTIDVETLKPGTFRSIDAIAAMFFGGDRTDAPVAS